MENLNTILTELGISKVRLAKYLGVSRQMLYNYLALKSLDEWPKEKAVKLLSLLSIVSLNNSKLLPLDNSPRLINSSSLIDCSSITPTFLLISDTSNLFSFVILDIKDLTEIMNNTLSL